MSILLPRTLRYCWEKMDSNKSVWTRIDDDRKLFFFSHSLSLLLRYSSSIACGWSHWSKQNKKKLKSWLKLYYAKDYHESSLIQWNNMWNTNKHRFNKPLSAMKWLQFILQKKMENFMNLFGGFFWLYLVLFSVICTTVRWIGYKVFRLRMYLYAHRSHAYFHFLQIEYILSLL